jgi:hypothetical protein
MKLLLLTFSLRNPKKDYEPFFVALRGNALNWWHFIEQTCVVSTEKDANSYAHLLYPHLEKTDSLLVAEIQPFEFQGWLPPAAWDWLNATSATISPPAPPLTILGMPPPPKQLK